MDYPRTSKVWGLIPDTTLCVWSLHPCFLLGSSQIQRHTCVCLSRVSPRLVFQWIKHSRMGVYRTKKIQLTQKPRQQTYHLVSQVILRTFCSVTKKFSASVQLSVVWKRHNLRPRSPAEPSVCLAERLSGSALASLHDIYARQCSKIITLLRPPKEPSVQPVAITQVFL